MLTAKNFRMDGPCCDIQTRNLILRVMSERGKDPYSHGFADDDEFDEFEDYGEFEHASEMRRDYLSDTFGFLTGKEGKKGVSPEEASAYADKIKEMLEKKGKAFLHTPEYFAALQDQDERMKAYRALKVTSNVPNGEEAEIAENPFKFLNLPKDATYGQTRAAWIMLSKMWYPDMMYPENRDQYERIFGKISFPTDGQDYDSWMKQIAEIMPPERLSVEQVEKLGPKEREEYTMKHDAYRKKELEYEKVKSDMRLRATEKMKIINKAYREAKKRFSKEEQESFAGFVWEKDSYDMSFFKGWSFISDDDYTYDTLSLEGEGEIRKDTGRLSSHSFPYLAFDYGDVYLSSYDYRQYLHLKSFFAWTELVQGKELCPTLLDDVVKFFKLDDHQSEQLRLMIMNEEKPKFIMDTISLSKLEKSYVLKHFLNEIYEGPTFSHCIGPMRADRIFPLGVEFTPEGGLVLNYKAQEDQTMSWYASKKTDQFSPTDMKMALAIAYGPLLAMD